MTSSSSLQQGVGERGAVQGQREEGAGQEKGGPETPEGS